VPNSELVHEAYIEPIKSVLLIDDMFPTYSSLIVEEKVVEDETEETFEDDEDLENDEAAQALLTEAAAAADHKAEKDRETQRALKLTTSCRTAGFIFDVENDPTTILEQSPDFINKPDLIVLDYILEPRLNSPEKSLQIIKRLNNSDRFNLVVLHSTKEPAEVLPEVACALKGKSGVNGTRGVLGLVRKIDHQLLEENVFTYLNSHGESAAFWKEKLKIEHNDENLILRAIPVAFDAYFNSKYPNVANENPADSNFETSRRDEGPHWVKGKNVFVAIAKKNDPDDSSIQVLISHMKAALTDYAPTPINMLLRKGINEFRAANIEVFSSMIGDSNIRAAIMYHSKASKTAIPEGVSEIGYKVSDLSRRTFAAFGESVHAAVGAYGEKLYKYVFPDKKGGYSDDDIISTAIAKEKVYSTPNASEVALALNAFLCSEGFTGSHLTNGVVFRELSGKKRYFVCATPSCDMIPRCSEKSGCYRNHLYPASFFDLNRAEGSHSNLPRQKSGEA